MLAKAKNYHANISITFFINFLPRKKKHVWGTFTKFREKNVLCKKGDKITQFDGIHLATRRYLLHIICLLGQIMYLII